jgi:hypothetical protein
LGGFGELGQVEGFRLWSDWVSTWLWFGLFHGGAPEI